MYTVLGINNVAQLYELTAEDLLKLDKFKDKKVDNVLKAIQNSKSVSLERLIFALGIDNVGQKTASDLARVYGSLDGLSKASAEDLTKIPDVGQIVAESVLEYFANDDNLIIISKLKEKGIDPQYKIKAGKFIGKNVVLTGSLVNFTRPQASEIIKNMGGNVQTSVGKNTTLVIVGENAGSKKSKAESLGIEIWDENRFAEEINTL